MCMSMIKGITVTLHTHAKTGDDDFGQPIFSDTTTTVDNVLVGQASSEAIANDMTIYGKRLAYTLAIPKGDTHTWTDTEVEFFGEKFRTYGDVIQGIEANIPLSWNKQIKVERYE